MPNDGVIQGLWIGEALSTMERLSIASFLAHGHEYHLYTYEDVKNVPAGTHIRDANEILPASAIFQYREQKSFSGFANYFRYKLLLERGGWWCDLDVVALRPFDFSAEYVFGEETTGSLQPAVNSGVIRAPQGASLLRFAWERCLGRDPRTLQWGFEQHAPPKSGLHRPKPRYAHQGGKNPPVIILHGNALEGLQADYKRYLENTFRKAFDLHGTPLRIQIKGGSNPYEGKTKAPLSASDATRLRREKRIRRVKWGAK